MLEFQIFTVFVIFAKNEDLIDLSLIPIKNQMFIKLHPS